ncbi:MAG: acetylglutamate kinase [Rickettsiales bacterium]|nr:acetylglutamate kinase [Rickettsiales bacterium]OUV82948.1 MAG: acetylglutamate kinase [Rickettsiales bacterium TMED131]|tara:strand:+ start:1519 stop:2385 length:867 start_codon:yes stop_codon:yes gene_type:complete
MINNIKNIISASEVEIKKNLKKYVGEILVIKYGGSAMIDPKLSINFSQNIKILVDLGIKPIIVHGGGPQINEMLEKLNIKPSFFNGMRITNKDTFDIVEMVLSGVINKNISFALSRKGINALGLSGVDSKIIIAKKYATNILTAPDLGLVGRPKAINKELLLELISRNIVPIITPIGSNNKGIKLNINADLTAGFIASEIKARRLLMLTDVKGVIGADSKLLSELKLKEVNKLIADKIIYGGMIPKVNTCIEAVKRGIRASVILDGRVKNALLKELLSDKGIGTLFRE